MIDSLKLKCENLLTLIPSNLYIHSGRRHVTERFTNLTIPVFLMPYIEASVERLIEERESVINDDNNENKVHLYIDPFKLCYLTWPLSEEDDHYSITLGPFIIEHLTSDEIRFMGYKKKLSSDNCFLLESFYGIVPFYDAIQLARISSMFLDYLSTVPHLPQIIREDHSILLPEEAASIEKKFESFDFVEHNYSEEAHFLLAIENGDVDKVATFMKAAGGKISLPPRFPSDPLRELKNLSITLNSIALRAAMKGGLNPSTAHSLSHNFAIQIEQQTSEKSIMKLREIIAVTYAESVRKYALKNHSDIIVRAITYIRENLTEKVGLTDIAASLHLSREYLSSAFKKEMGITLTDFIHKTKAEESFNLLSTGRYTISQIAYTFGYSSPAHYSKAFTKAVGISPKQWQISQKMYEK